MPKEKVDKIKGKTQKKFQIIKANSKHVFVSKHNGCPLSS